MAQKQLIVAVEGTAAMGPYWFTILSDYLDKMIRSFVGNELAVQKPSTYNVAFSLVMFNSHGSYSACVVRRSGWTTDIDIFFQWLSAIPFSGGGFNDAAISEGLAEALMMFSATNGNQTQSGKRSPRVADLPVDTSKNPHFLVLISENFMEARAALTRSGVINLASNQSPVKMDVTSGPSISGPASVPSISGPTSSSNPAVNGSVIGRQPISVGNIPPATVKVEPSSTSIVGPAFPHISSVPRTAPQAVPSLPTSPPVSTSQEMISNNENVQEMKPLVSNVTQPLRPAGGAAANVRILNDVAQARQGLPSMGGTPMLSNMISNGMASSVPPAQTVIPSGPLGAASVAGSLPMTGIGQVAQNSAPASFTTSTASNMPGNPNIGLSQPMSNLQGSVNMGQMVPGMSQGNLPVTQMVQSGIVMNQSLMNGSGASGMPTGAGPVTGTGTGTMIPTLGMSQQMQPGMQTVGVSNNNSAANMTLNQQTSSTMNSAQSKYVKVWEGNLSGQRQGQPVFITSLEGYRSASASETLAANWPPTMQIVRLISQDHMNNKQYVGKADFLVFRAMNQHGFLGQLQEKKLCAVIQLPSQTLLLSVSDKACRLIGMLFPGDMVVFKPQISSQQQPQQHPQLQQQQLQPQQQPLAQLQQQQPLMQQQTPQLQQQTPQLQQPQQQQMSQLQLQQQQQQPQAMVGTGMNQAYIQGGGRSQLLSQGQVSSQGQPSLPGGAFMN
ncbi:unnamed protein product [Fraxinus pennsylvanica]|uniref:Mediator of RNA polymerase II transcription subunit 25 n=1 Tax=Fraxinus pennsylvanica TaxID=56036 RepID=A0AAD2DY59_9LAMI|nr:unnamed protein product [Fraxinus pennsylvanica]